MAQQICYIITPINIKTPIDIVHFKEKNSTVIPLLIEDSDVVKLLSSASNSQSVIEFIEDAIMHLLYEYPTRKVFDFLAKIELQTFGIVYYYDHFFVPKDTKPVLFIDDKRIDVMWDNFNQDIHQKLGCEITLSEILKNEEKYWHFLDAEQYYFRQLEKNCH